MRGTVAAHIGEPHGEVAGSAKTACGSMTTSQPSVEASVTGPARVGGGVGDSRGAASWRRTRSAPGDVGDDEAQHEGEQHAEVGVGPVAVPVGPGAVVT